jgi:MFS family permease
MTSLADTTKPESAAGGMRPPSVLRTDLRVILYAWLFGAFWLWTISGAAMTQFARAIHTPDWAFGLLSAMPYFGAMFQLPASIMLARYGRRKTLFLWTVMTGRLLWVVAAAIPWVLPNYRDAWWPLMVICLTLSHGCNNAGTPAWMDWMADVIPSRVRARYFAVRFRYGQIAGLVATLSIGYVLDIVDRAHDSNLLMLTTSLILGVAGLMGTMDIVLFRRVDDADARPKEKSPPLLEMLKQPLRNREFRWFLLYNFVLFMSLGFVGQYIWLYVYDVVKVTNTQANLLLIAVPLIMMAISYTMWGKLIDRVGRKPTIMIAGVVTANGALWWIFVGHGLWPVTWFGYEFSLVTVVGYIMCITAMLTWPGVELANFNFLLGLAGTRESKRTGGGYVALNAMAVAVGGAMSGVIAGGLAKWLGPGWTAVVPVIGLTLTYHSVLFLISTVGRYIALLCVLPMHEPTALSTRYAFRYSTSLIYENARSIAVTPMRVAGRVARWSYRG